MARFISPTPWITGTEASVRESYKAYSAIAKACTHPRKRFDVHRSKNLAHEADRGARATLNVGSGVDLWPVYDAKFGVIFAAFYDPRFWSPLLPAGCFVPEIGAQIGAAWYTFCLSVNAIERHSIFSWPFDGDVASFVLYATV